MGPNTLPQQDNPKVAKSHVRPSPNVFRASWLALVSQAMMVSEREVTRVVAPGSKKLNRRTGYPHPSSTREAMGHESSLARSQRRNSVVVLTSYSFPVLECCTDTLLATLLASQLSVTATALWVPPFGSVSSSEGNVTPFVPSA